MSNNRRTDAGAQGKRPKQRWSAAKRAAARKSTGKPMTPRQERRAATRQGPGQDAVERGRRADERRDREWEGGRSGGRDRWENRRDRDDRRGGYGGGRSEWRDRNDRSGFDRNDRDRNDRAMDNRDRNDGGRRDNWRGRDDYRGRENGRDNGRDTRGRGQWHEREDRPGRRWDGDDRRGGDRPGYGERRGGGRQWEDRGGYRSRDNRQDDRGRRDFRNGDRDREDSGYRNRGVEKRPFEQDRPRGDRPGHGEHRGGGRQWEDRSGYRPRNDRSEDRGDRYERRERREVARGVETHSAYEAERLRRTERPRRVDLPEDPSKGFQGLGVPMPIVERLARDGIAEPFPIQEATIPDAIAGRDVLGRGRTGSGKTMAFGIPVLTRLAGLTSEPRHPRALILSPTRELAMQIADALGPLAREMKLSHKLVAGGMPYEPQITALDRGVDVLVATPGRINDLVERGAAVLDQVEIFVLDEADLMADMGFMPEVTALLDLVPADGQRLLFSATLDKGVDTLVEKYLRDPVEHSTDDAVASVSTMTHHIFLVEPQHKKLITGDIANRPGRTVVFVRTKLGADRVAMQLREQGVFAAALHGGLNQGMRNRILAAFKDGTLPVLVATDVASRGIHVDDVSAVLQVDPPKDNKDYLHRAGRTARAGSEGVVVTLALPHQRKLMKRIADDAGLGISPQHVDLGDEEIIAATGASRPSGVPVPEDRLRAVTDPPRRPRNNRGGYGRRQGGYRGGGGYRSGGGYRGGGDRSGYRGDR